MTDIYVTQKLCVYCGVVVRPMSYDHFIPQSIAHVIRTEALVTFDNYLLPCCTVCNNIAQQYLFTTFLERWQFIAWGNSGHSWQISENPQHEILYYIRVPEDILTMIIPAALMTRTDQYVILCPKFVDGDWNVSQAVEHFIDGSRYRGSRLSSRVAGTQPSA